MKKALFITLVLFLARSISYAQADPAINKISAYLNELGKDEYFSLSIAIAKDDKLVLQKAYGYANREHKVANTTDTRFNMASMGKMFTAVAILQLYDAGKLALNEKIGKYIPNFPNKEIRDSVTIHQLLTHSSGLPLWFNTDFNANSKFQYAELKDYLPFYNSITIDHNKAGKHYYSNVGFFVLAYIIEGISGMSYQDYLSAHIFEPLLMNHTGLYKLTDIIPNSATGYVRPADKHDVWKNNYGKNLGSSPAGGAFASAPDMITFYTALKNNKLLKPATTELMCSPKVSSPNGQYGYGFMIDMSNKHIITGHQGAYYGIRSELFYYKDAKYTVSIMANSDQTDYDDISYFIRTELTGSVEQKDIYANTLRLVNDAISGKFIVDESNCSKIASNKHDEDLIEIKAYYYLNNNDYEQAVKLFKLNTLLFPNSENAKANMNMVIKRRDG